MKILIVIWNGLKGLFEMVLAIASAPVFILWGIAILIYGIVRTAFSFNPVDDGPRRDPEAVYHLGNGTTHQEKTSIARWGARFIIFQVLLGFVIALVF